MAGKAVNRAIQNVVAVMDILRRQRVFEHDAVFEVGHAAGALELVEDDLAIRRKHFLPVMLRSQIRCMNQDVKRLAAFGRSAGFTASRRREVTGWVGRGFTFFVDEIKLLVRVAAENKVMMGEMFVTFVQPEIEHDAGTGSFIVTPFFKLRADAAVDEFAVGADGITVGNDGGEVDFFAVIRAHAGDGVAIRQNFFNLGVGMDYDAEFARQFG